MHEEGKLESKVKSAQLSSGANGGHGISEPFIRRPITTTLIMLGIVIFGFIGYRSLP